MYLDDHTIGAAPQPPLVIDMSWTLPAAKASDPKVFELDLKWTISKTLAVAERLSAELTLAAAGEGGHVDASDLLRAAKHLTGALAQMVGVIEAKRAAPPADSYSDSDSDDDDDGAEREQAQLLLRAHEYVQTTLGLARLQESGMAEDRDFGDLLGAAESLGLAIRNMRGAVLGDVLPALSINDALLASSQALARALNDLVEVAADEEQSGNAKVKEIVLEGRLLGCLTHIADRSNPDPRVVAGPINKVRARLAASLSGDLSGPLGGVGALIAAANALNVALRDFGGKVDAWYAAWLACVVGLLWFG